MQHYSFEVQRNDLACHQLVPLPAPDAFDLAAGEALIRVDRFGLTANNITYGVAGDLIGYWQFFPAADPWGRIPVWGVGTVTHPGDSGLRAGEEFYGYFPMSSYLKVKPDQEGPRGFFDVSAHRAQLPSTYNQYLRMSTDNGFDRRYDAHRMVYFPLFVTGFILDDWLDDNEFFGADTIVLSSASSKTAFSLAHQLRQRGSKRVVGLTSRGNRAFVSGLDLYDEVLCYDEVTQLEAGTATAYVDMAGNRELLSALHHHLGDAMVCSAGVGITHWGARDADDPASLPGATPTLFFAPTQMQKRVQEWGAAGYQKRLDDAWCVFLEMVDEWVTICESSGADALVQTYERVLGGAPPDEAYVVGL
jgi:hypothetical protein